MEKHVMNIGTSSVFQSRMLQELKKEFTNDEQEMFVANFYMYLNYHQTDDYPISLDDIWKWLGFSKKGNAKKLLMDKFNLETDYKIVTNEENSGATDSTESLLRSEKQTNRGGQNEEYITMNVFTFKRFCLKSNTTKAEPIRFKIFYKFLV